MNEYLPDDQQDIDDIQEETTLVEDYECWEGECDRIREQEEIEIAEAADRAIENNHR